MKKLLYSILALAGVVATSCQQENIDVVYRPENVTPAQIVEVNAGDIEAGVKTEVKYTDVNYNMNASAPIYALYVAKSGADMENKQKLSVDFAKSADNEDGSKSVFIDATTINNILTKKLEAEYGQEISVDFQIETSVSNEKGTAVAGTEVYSNIVTVSYTPVEIKEALPDAEEFDKVWVIGDYCGWSHDKTQFLFDYAASGNVYSGVIDFGGKAANGFKLTGVAAWDDACNWGLEDNKTAEAEASSLQLITGGGSQDIKSYSKRYYKFSFDKTSLILTKEFGFDSVGVVGVGNNWDTDAAQMEFNPVYCRFYADVTFAAGDQFKCRADGAWTLSWGVNADATEGAENVKVADAGNYRVYLNLNKGTLELNADMYGKQEPGVTGGGTTPEPEPEPQPGIEADRWGIVGTINNWGGTPDLYMSEVGENLYVRMGVAVTADDQFKVRFNNAWDINYGAPGDVEPYAVTVGEEMALVAGGKNLSAPAGTYDIYFNIADFKMWVMPEGETPEGVEVKTLKIYGDVSATGWTNCYAWIWDAAANYTGGNWPGEALSMEGDYYVWNVPASLTGATVNVIFSNGEGDQTVDITGVVLSDDVVITLTDNEGGKWNATINGEAPVTPEPEPEPAVKEYGLVGEFNGWGSSSDLLFEDYQDGYLCVTNVSLEAGKGFKVRFYNDGTWNSEGDYALERGASTVIGEAMTLKHGGDSDNLSVPTTGTYDIYFNPTACIMYIMNAGTAPEITTPAVQYGLVGEFNGWGGSSDMLFTDYQNGYLYVTNVSLEAGKGFKVRFYNDGTWNSEGDYALERGASTVIGEAMTLKHGGDSDNLSVPTTGTYDIYFNPTTCVMYVMVAGEVPAI